MFQRFNRERKRRSNAGEDEDEVERLIKCYIFIVINLLTFIMYRFSKNMFLINKIMLEREISKKFIYVIND